MVFIQRVTGSRPCSKPREGQLHRRFLVMHVTLTFPILFLKCPRRVPQTIMDTGPFVQVHPDGFHIDVVRSLTCRPPRPSSRR